MEYKITNVSEVSNDYEKQRAKEAKEFSKALAGLVASVSAGLIGAGSIVYSFLFFSSHSPFVLSLSAFVQIYSHGVLVPRYVGKLTELYNKRVTVVDNSEDLSLRLKK